MSVNNVGSTSIVAGKKRPIHRDGIPEQIPGANPMEPLGKDHFAATGNAVGKATENSIDTLMKVVRSPEVSIAAVTVATAVVGVATVGLIVGGPRVAVQGAKLAATIGGGVGMFGAGIAMACDKNLNTYHKTIAVPMLLSVGAGLAIATGFTFGGTESVQAAMGSALEGIRVGSAVGVAGATLLTGGKGIRDFLSPPLPGIRPLLGPCFQFWCAFHVARLGGDLCVRRNSRWLGYPGYFTELVVDRVPR